VPKTVLGGESEINTVAPFTGVTPSGANTVTTDDVAFPGDELGDELGEGEAEGADEGVGDGDGQNGPTTLGLIVVVVVSTHGEAEADGEAEGDALGQAGCVIPFFLKRCLWHYGNT
jgi:hypothetical protein